MHAPVFLVGSRRGKEKHDVTFNQIKQLFAFETQGKYCAEILFSVNESTKFNFCWMGKTSDDAGEDVYWFGLTPDGKYAFDYPTFEEFSTVKVFDGKSLFEMWDDITVLEINGCDPIEMLTMYLSKRD